MPEKSKSPPKDKSVITGITKEKSAFTGVTGLAHKSRITSAQKP